MSSNNNIWFPETCIDDELLKETKLNENGLAESSLWKNRPSRLSLYNNIDSRILRNKEQNRLGKLLSVNYYSDKDLKKLVPNEYQLNGLTRNIPPLERKVVFPAVNNKYKDYFKKNIITPLATYSGFIDAETLFDSFKNIRDKYVKSSKKLNKLLKNYLNINNTKILIPEIALFVDYIDGKSYELAYILNAWLNTNNYLYNNLRFYCTGEINESGDIKPITYELIKFEAAKNGNFDYVIFPTGNKKIIEENFKKELEDDFNQALNTGSRKYLFFSTVFELNEWLLENAESDKNKVLLWASTNRKEPNSELLNNFFEKDYDNYNVALNKITQSLINSDEKIKKIYYLTSKYLDYLSLDNESDNNQDEIKTDNYIEIANKNNFDKAKKNRIIFSKLSNFLPKDIFYFCYLYFFMSSNDSDISEEKDYSSKIYIDISNALTETNVDLSLACKRFDKYSACFHSKILNTINKRFYKLLCLLFRNPLELLYKLSLNERINDDKNSIAYKILSILIEESKKGKYDENYIMNKIFGIFSEDISILNYDSVAIREIFKKLGIARNNFEKNNTEACLACGSFYKLIVDSLNKPIEDKEFLWQIYNNNCKLSEDIILEKIIKLKLKDFYYIIKNKNIIKKSVSNELDYKIEVEKYINNINYLLEFYKEKKYYYSKMPISQIGYFPQIALDIYYFFEESQGEKNYKSIKNAFDNFYQKGESNELKIDCLDYWVGYNWGNCFYDIIKYNSLPLIIGYIKKNASLCDKNICKVIQWLCENSNKYNKIIDLLWISLLPDCKKCLFDKLSSFVLDLYNNCKEYDSKNILNLKFIDALLNLEVIKDNDFDKSVCEWLKQNNQRRTLQILAPLYLTLLNKEDSCILSDNSFGQTNNSQFITEFLSVFVLSDSKKAIFKPILWQSSIDNQMFNTIAITMIKDNYSLLKQFLLNKVNDLPNRLLALKMLKNFD